MYPGQLTSLETYAKTGPASLIIVLWSCIYLIVKPVCNSWKKPKTAHTVSQSCCATWLHAAPRAPAIMTSCPFHFHKITKNGLVVVESHWPDSCHNNNQRNKGPTGHGSLSNQNGPSNSGCSQKYILKKYWSVSPAVASCQLDCIFTPHLSTPLVALHEFFQDFPSIAVEQNPPVQLSSNAMHRYPSSFLAHR